MIKSLCGVSAVIAISLSFPATAKEDAAATPHEDVCFAGDVTTAQINECLWRKLSDAKEKMALYWSAAYTRFENETVNAPHNKDSDRIKRQALEDMDRSQEKFEIYRETHCDSVYYHWREGTIRNAMTLQCNLRLVNARTMEIWQTWLTYPDSTPPILPKP